MQFSRTGVIQPLDVGRGRLGEQAQAAPAGGVAPQHERLVLWRALPALALALAAAAALYVGLSGGGGGGASVAGARAHGFSRAGLLSLPQAAQGPVSAALGADSRAYRVRAGAGGLSAANPAQRLSARFTSAGVSVSVAATRLTLSTRRAGFGSALAPLGVVAPHAHGNRVLYQRNGLSEWYANGPLGLEQGFTLARAPSAHPVGPLTLSLALSGNARPSLADDGQSLTLTRAGKAVLRYDGLSATDARGRALRSWLDIQRGQLLLRVDARGARYPVRIDPFIQQGEKLEGSGRIGHPYFGESVAVSSDGNTALIGGSGDNEDVGAAWVFTRTGTTWTQQGPKLTGFGETGKGLFGTGVALSSDGNTALIGGSGDNAEVGAAWVFTRSGESWTQQGEKLTGGGEVGAGRFGYSVALSSEANTALIGASRDNGKSGAAWVFTRSGESWTQQGEKLTGFVGGEGHFGKSVSLSGDGYTALIGAFNSNEGIGAAFVFTRSGESWRFQQGFTGEGEVLRSKPNFGWSVALSADGRSALIGAPNNENALGGAWAFTRSDEKWKQVQELRGTEKDGSSRFGYSVALSADGSTALIGGPRDASGNGAAWPYAIPPEVTGVTPNNGPTAGGTTVTIAGARFTGATAVQFGGNNAASFTVNSDSSITAVSPPGATGTVNVRVTASDGTSPWQSSDQFTYGPVVTGVSPAEGPAAGGTTVTISGSTFTGATAVRFGANNAASFTVNSDNSITAVSPPAAAGTTDVTVTSPEGTSATSPADRFSYQPPPTEPVFVSKGELGAIVATHIPIAGTLGSSFLETKSGTKISCRGGTLTGEITGLKSVAKEVLKFTGRESGGQPCGNTGEREITTKSLAARLQAISTTVPGERLGSETAEGAVERRGTVAEFTCAGVQRVVVQGTVIGNLSGAAGETEKAAQEGAVLSHLKLTLAQSGGVQKYCKFSEGTVEEKECEQLESSTSGAAFEKAGESAIAQIETVPPTWGIGVTK